MDTALKQRLIGAAVLVALAVIFLPMLLEGPAPDGGASNVPLQMPEAPDRRFETRELPLVPPAQPGDAADPADAAAAPTDDPNRIVTVDADDAPRPDALAGDPSTAPADLTARVVAPEQAAMPATTAASEAPAVPAPAPAAAQPEPAPPVQAPAPAARSEGGMSYAAQAGGRYVVNLGSYTNQANARALVDALKAAQLPAYAENINVGGQNALRVRVGPYSQRATAESARLRALQARSDVPASVVSLDAGQPAPAQPAARAVDAGFAVQVGAFRAEADANALRDRLRGGGFVAFSERIQAESGVLWRVRVGPEPDRAAAERLRARVNERFRLNGMVVAHP